MSQSRQTRRLVERLLVQNRELDEAEKAEILSAVQSDEAVRRSVKEHLLMDNLLSRTFSPERRAFTNRVLQRIQAPAPGAQFIARTLSATGQTDRGRRWTFPWSTFGWAAMAACASAAVVLFAMWPERLDDPEAARASLASGATILDDSASEPQRPRVVAGEAMAAADLSRIERTTGAVFVVGFTGREAAPGTPLSPGQGLVVVGDQSGVTLGYRDGTRVEIRGDGAIMSLASTRSSASATGSAVENRRQLFVSRGRVEIDVRTQPPNTFLVFSTPRGEAVVAAGRFTLSVSDRQTRVDVAAGAVRFAGHRGGAPAQVAAGRYAITQEGEEPTLATRAARGRAVMLIGSDNPKGIDSAGVNAADRAIKERLQKLGLEVQMTRSGPHVRQEMRSSDLIVLSDSTSSLDVEAAWLRELPVPLVVMEWFSFDDLGLTAPCGQEEECGAFLNPTGHLVMKDPQHPLAAGLSGTIRFSGRWTLVNWGTPSLLAAWVATLPGHPNRVTLFAYEKGAQMVGLAAPARRVAIPIRGTAPASLTDDGWALFDAAIDWSVSRPQSP